ncbi:MAG: hypothetical protein SNJ83_10370 [Aggregatilineales bacterium]
MKSWYKMCWVILTMAVVVWGVQAQDDRGNPNDPSENERANACFTGGSWEGKCHRTDVDFDGDVDEQDVNWMWRCGWYVIRVERGLLNEGQYPSECYTKPRFTASAPSCPPIVSFTVPDAPLPALLSTLSDIFDFVQSRGLVLSPLTPANLTSIALTYYNHSSTIISPDPRGITSFPHPDFPYSGPRASGINYTITADIGFDGCYDITVRVTSDTINLVESNLPMILAMLP